jgi:hypothetical protein
MTDEITSLREQVAYLQGLVRELRSGREEAEIQRLLFPSATVARLIVRLYEANGNVVCRSDLDSIPTTPGNLKIWIWQIRKALGPDSVVPVKGLGYRLTPAGLLAVREIIEPETLCG